MSTMNTPERLWRTQFNKQLTDEMMERVLKQTIALVRKVERKTPWKDLQTADDRLHTAIVKTLDKTLVWDPDRVDLERFFLGAIAGDISHEIEHAERFPQTSLDDEKQNQDVLEAETSDALAGERVAKNEVPKAAWWSEVMSALRAVIDPDDTGVLAILDAYEHGKYTRREVMAHTGLSSKQYHAAYQRLMRAAQKLDDDTRELIFQAIA
jgi:hypothetical protein